MMKNIVILGSTGSIGVNTLDVIARHPDRFHVYALTAHRNIDLLFKQCQQFHPDYAIVVNEQLASLLRDKINDAGLKTDVLMGTQALQEITTHDSVDDVVAAIVGGAGLLATFSAATAGKRILLANKEALVMSGPLFMNAIRTSGAQLLPIDSEHNAIFQCMQNESQTQKKSQYVRRLILTASGGPFRSLPLDQFEKITPEAACAHPNWKMGKKISVDSATMMNKTLEVIEAHWLFNIPPSQIDVLLHPQSIIHSMVEYSDGSVLAQMGQPDMRTPIAQALAWPDRIESGVTPLDFLNLKSFTFEPMDPQRFPCIKFAYDVLKMGGTAPTILNAANEVAVDAFLHQKIRYIDIYHLIGSTLDRVPHTNMTSLDDVLDADKKARRVAQERLHEYH